MAQVERRNSPYPSSWEIPAAVAALVFVAVVVAAQVGRSLANWIAGAGWRFASTDLLSGVRVLGGDPVAGLADVAYPAGPGLLWTCVAVMETLVVVVAVLVAVALLARYGPGRLRGAAPRGHVQRTVGVARLRRNASLIRPDLYPQRRRRAR